MTKLLADQYDFRNAFKKHYHSFSALEKTGSEISRRLILFYCVECGLKYLVMKDLRINRVDQARNDIVEVLGSHDIEKMLTIHLKQTTFRFPTFKTIHSEQVIPIKYHQVCRYAIGPTDSKEISKENAFFDELVKVSKWIYERV